MSISNLSKTEKGTVIVHRIKPPADGLVHIKQSEAAKKIAKELYGNNLNEFVSQIKSETFSDSVDVPKKKKDKKAKKKKKQKKQKKVQKKVNAYSSQLDTSSRKQNNGATLAKILSTAIDIKVVGDTIYLYDLEAGFFKPSNKQQVMTAINSWLEENRDDFLKFSMRDNKEAVERLMTDASIQAEELDKAYNKPYILCKNGVLDLNKMILLDRSPKYGFTNCLNANYDENSKGEKFKKFINHATNGDESLKKLIQEVMGYLISNYTYKRTAFTLGVKSGTGKSTILNSLIGLIGAENKCEVPLNLMENEYQSASILTSRLNIVPDHNKAVIKDISRFKSFVSDNDFITGRRPCEMPFSRRCRTKMIFGTNHHFNFSGLGADDLEAFFDRMIYIPFNRKFESKIDGFSDLLIPEYDYILTWASKGLHRLIENNFQFTECPAAERMKLEAMAQCNPEEVFFQQCLKSAEDRYESSSAITEAFKYFCLKNNIKGNFNIAAYLDMKNILKTRKRINDGGWITSEGNPVYVYEGIRLKAKYRVS